ncbi:MAG: GPP34 family phosphoprotein [Desulfatirhabdiaceae bacterium]
MLSFAEEIYLLALDETTGKPMISPRNIEMQSALVGAILGELSFLQRIDTDIDKIYLLDATPTQNPVLDHALSLISGSAESQTISFWMKELLADTRFIENHVLQELINKKILKQEDKKILWVFPSRQYPVIDGRELQNIEMRLRNLILSDEIPEPRETVLVSLVDACGFFQDILSPREYQRSQERIALLARMDAIGRAVANLIQVINKAYIMMHMG